MGNFAMILLIILILFIGFGYLPIKMEENNIKIGHIYKRIDYTKKDTDPFQTDENEYARIVDLKYDENNVLWVKYFLYKRGEISNSIECTEQAFSFLMRYIKVD